MVKPNDTVALIIGLHIVVLALIAWLLFRFIRVFPTVYSVTSTSIESSVPPGDGPPPAPPPPFSPFNPGPRVNLGGRAGGAGRGGKAGPGGRVNAMNAKPGP